MINEKNILAIIPARGGSKGIPRKNIRLLSGKPLIVHTIRSAQKSRYLDKIIVSTDDEEIARISGNAGAEVVIRPKKLAKDSAPVYSAIEHACRSYRPGIVVILQPTSPLRTSQDIDRAVKIFLKNKRDSVVSVCESERSVYWSFWANGRYLNPIIGKKYFNLRRQDLPKVYIPNGAIFVFSYKKLLKCRGLYCGNILPYFMPADRSIDIDEENDFLRAEKIFKNEKKQNHQ